ncbi:MAG: hypothetical protein HY028_07190 [Gammaproteobacteria bacterium]|nr:hypothetical protein [Gammaproteobacteria bacterium]
MQHFKAVEVVLDSALCRLGFSFLRWRSSGLYFIWRAAKHAICGAACCYFFTRHKRRLPLLSRRRHHRGAKERLDMVFSDLPGRKGVVLDNERLNCIHQLPPPRLGLHTLILSDTGNDLGDEPFRTLLHVWLGLYYFIPCIAHSGIARLVHKGNAPLQLGVRHFA